MSKRSSIRTEAPERTSRSCRGDPAVPVMRVGVECRAGDGDEETPLRLRFGDQTVEVAEIMDRWPGTDHRYFKVMGANGAIYILRHDVDRDFWELTMFTSERMR